MSNKRITFLTILAGIFVVLLILMTRVIRAEPILFSPDGHSVGATGYEFTDMVTADLDLDGDMDLVTANALGQLHAWENNGTPFTGDWPVTLMGRRRRTSALAAGDLDGDGDVDIASGYRWSTELVIWENSGHPFTDRWSSWLVGNDLAYLGALAIGDVDGNGRNDIVSGGGPSADVDYPSASNRVTLWLNAPFANMWTAVDLGEAYYSVRDIVLGDLDGDGDMDVVFGTNHAPAVGSSDAPVPSEEWPNVYQVRAFQQLSPAEWVHVNIGRDPEFETLSVLYHGFWGAHVSALDLADIDGDGDPDVVASEHMEGDFQVLAYENDATPFSGELWRGMAIAYPLSRFHNWLAANVMDVVSGDFDEDGDIDLASVSNQTETHQIIVWENLGGLMWEDWSEMVYDPARVGQYSQGWLRHDIGITGANMLDIAAADMDGDTDLDLVAAGVLAVPPNALTLWQNGLVGPQPTATPAPSATPTSTPSPTMTPTPVGNVAPTAGTFAPNGGSGPVLVPQRFTTTFLDANGWQDIRAAYFLLNSGLGGQGLSAVYYPDTQRFYLATDSGSGWVGWCTAGDNAQLANSYVQLDCQQSSAGGSDATLTVNWQVTPLAPFAGAYGPYTAYVRAMDWANNRLNWTAVGTWTLLNDPVPPTPTPTIGPTPTPTFTPVPSPTTAANVAPAAGTFSPDGGSGVLGVPQVFVTTYLDGNGWQDIAIARFVLNETLGGQGLTAVYYRDRNRIYLANDGGTGWLGYCTPGAAQVLNNGVVAVNCGETAVSGSGTTLTLTWAVTPLLPFGGSYNPYTAFLQAADSAGLTSSWTASGTWTLLP